MKILLLVFLAMVAHIEGSSDYGECKKPEMVLLSHKFLLTKHWTIIKHSNCENCKHGKSLAPMFGRSPPDVEQCWTMKGTLKNHGSFSAPMKCHYSLTKDRKFVNSAAKCELQTKRNPKLGGTDIVFATDNKTYMIGALCILHKENWWFIAVVKGTKVEDEQMKTFLAHVSAAGFNATNVATEGTDDVIFKEYEVTKDCTPV